MTPQPGLSSSLQGVKASHIRYEQAQHLLRVHGDAAENDCHWKQQVNHAAFHSFSWFLAPDGDKQFSCGANVRIFVDERSDWQHLRANPLGKYSKICTNIILVEHNTFFTKQVQNRDLITKFVQD